MAGWSGFSDAEIRRMRTDLNQDMASEEENDLNGLEDYRLNTPARKITSLGAKKSSAVRQQIPNRNQTKPNIDKKPSKPSTNGAMQNSSQSQGVKTDCSSSPDSKNETESINNNGANVNEDIKILEDEEVQEMELKSIETYQRQQKEMEEMNKKKKAMLLSAIEERKRQATRESSKLQEIQRELGKLDDLLSCDVSILRDKIELACREYSEAQKRYDRAEQEFVSAKLDLHHKCEIKDGLTEHLYVIIHQNELRRAKKLAELMTKLDMESSNSENEDVILCDPHINAMSAVQTLGPSGPTNPTKLIIETLGVEKRSENKIETESESDYKMCNDKTESQSESSEQSPPECDQISVDNQKNETETESITETKSALRETPPRSSPENKKVRFIDDTQVRELEV